MSEVLVWKNTSTALSAYGESSYALGWCSNTYASPTLSPKIILIIDSNDSTHLSMKQKLNLETLDNFKALQFNWNGNNAEPFSESLIEKAKSIIFHLKYQPEVFPTAKQSVQFEYEKENGDYLEFEIFEDSITCLQIVSGNESESQIKDSEIFSKLDQFYTDDRNLRF